MMSGVFSRGLKKLPSSILFFMSPVIKIKGIEILLIALNEKIRLTKKTRYKIKSRADKNLFLFSCIGFHSFFQTVFEIF